MTTFAFLTPVQPGQAPSMSRCTHAARTQAIFDTLQAGWADYRGCPWPDAYSQVLARVPGLRNLRLALTAAPAVLFEADVTDAAGMEALRREFGPVLDLVYSGCAAYPGAGDGAAFGHWVRAGTPASNVTPTTRELRYPPAAAVAAGAAAPALSAHALADFERLSPLFALPRDSQVLRSAASRLLPSASQQLARGVALAGETLSAVLAPVQAPALSVLQQVGQFFSGLFASAGPNKIQVKGKQQVMDVLTDVDDRYSVCGYAPRMEASLGLIFLGMDQSDPRYLQQSAQANAAIHTVTELEAFTEALAATREALAAGGGAPHLDIKDLSDQVLAKLCTLWFDIPDGTHVIASGSIWPGLSGHCPGHYAPVSGSIFQPEPVFGLPLLAQLDGRQLRTGVGAFVKERRDNGPAPAGRLSSALFAAFPSRDQDDLLASTIIGVMMGFLPTAQGNLLAIFSDWDANRLGALRNALMARPEQDLWERAYANVRSPMIEAMQKAPVPPAIWRTATKDHQLGSQPVKKNDLVYINLDSATRDDLSKGVQDPVPIFGGDRDASPHPTHACPGLWMGMGVLLGFCTGVLESQEPPSAFTALSATAVH